MVDKNLEDNMQLTILTPVTLKQGQGYQTWYELVVRFLKKSCRLSLSLQTEEITWLHSHAKTIITKHN